MTREEAIKRIKIHMHIHRMAEDRAVYITEALNMAIEALEADVPSTKVGEWIPTSKKLPKLDQPVLVWMSGDYWIADLHLLNGELCWGFDDFDLSGEDFDNVRAWMPLPEPYTEDNDG